MGGLANVVALPMLGLCTFFPMSRKITTAPTRVVRLTNIVSLAANCVYGPYAENIPPPPEDRERSSGSNPSSSSHDPQGGACGGDGSRRIDDDGLCRCAWSPC